MRLRAIVYTLCAISLSGCDSGAEARRGERPAPRRTGAEEPTSPAKEDGSRSKDDAGEASPKSASGESELRLDRLVFKVPQDWQPKAPSSSFVLAEYALPKAPGDDADGRLTVSVAGGTVAANIDRWRDQFGGSPESSSEENVTINGLEVALVDYAGDFNDQRGPFTPATKRPGYRMLAAIIPVGGELHFVKAVGPKATIAAHADRFNEFVRSVSKSN